MSLLTRIKRLLGFDGSAQWEDKQPAAVTVEHEPNSESEPEPETAPEPEPEPEPELDSEPEPEPEPETAPEPEPEPEPELDSESEPEPEPETASESEPASDADEGSTEPVTSLDGIGPTYGQRLEGAGIETVADLAAADPEDLAATSDISETRLERWIDAAKQWSSG